MTQALCRIIEAFRGQRILVVGDLILDRYLYGDAERISPEAPVPVLRTTERTESVGGSANVAACLAALGCLPTIIGVVGDDPDGARLCNLLEAIGVNTSLILRDATRPTTTKTRLIGLAQHRHRQQLLRVDDEVTVPLSGELADRFLENARAAARDHAVICVEDYDKGLITQSLVESLVYVGSQRGTKVLVDPARIGDYTRYGGADVLTPNRYELSLAAGMPISSLADVASAADRVLTAASAKAMVVTLDRDGAAVVARGNPPRHVPTQPRSVYDNTGAGDAVLAMLAAAIAAGADLVRAARLANIAGGLEVEKFGCVPIRAEEVLAELRLEDRAGNGKVRGEEELAAELTLRRDRGETIAFTNGCFDILHAGHVDYLRRCRREASLLVVGLNGDESVRALGKGDGRPINRFAERAAVLAAVEYVDYIVRFDDPDPDRLIRRLRPDVLLKGEDWADKGVVGREFVESYGGRVVLLPLVEGLSTTAIMERIRRGGR